jgi:hypothetical protein
MKEISLLFILFVIINIFDCISQKINKLENVNLNDFQLSGEKSIILYDESMIHFPYMEYKNLPGAFDETFTLEYERLIRYLCNSNGINDSVLLIPKKLKVKPHIKALQIFFIQNNKVNSEKIKSAKIDLIDNQNGIFLKVPVYDSYKSFIIDVMYDFKIESKDSIQAFFDNSKLHKNVIMNIIIPEIFKYDEDSISDCVEKEKTEELAGPVIGYKMLNHAPLFPYIWGLFNYQTMLSIKSKTEILFEQVNCKNYSTNYSVRLDCINNDDLFPIIISLKLSSMDKKYQPPPEYYKPKNDK